MKKRLLIFQSPTFIIVTLLLFINDFLLKNLYPGEITGKISDFTGMFIFPIFLYSLIGRKKRLVFLFSGLSFILWKSPLSVGFIDLWNSLTFIQIGRVIDYTDLVALLIIPIAYQFKPTKLITVNNPILKYSFGVFTLFCIIASETTEVKFENKVKGTNPYGLIGDYQLRIIQKDTSYIDTITIKRIIKSDYLLTLNHKDTLYLGEIKMKKGNYYLNKKDNNSDYWNINCFKIVNDSIYNFYPALFNSNEKIIEYFDYWDYKTIEKEDLTTYIIDNDKKETLEAFSLLLDSAKGISFNEIIRNNDTIRSVSRVSSKNSVKSDIQQNEWKIFPNPCKDKITIEQSIQSNSTVRLINLSGKVIKQEKTNSKILNWNLHELKTGIYIVELYNGESEVKTLKLIKK